jgi:hypothetical protein
MSPSIAVCRPTHSQRTRMSGAPAVDSY